MLIYDDKDDDDNFYKHLFKFFTGKLLSASNSSSEKNI